MDAGDLWKHIASLDSTVTVGLKAPGTTRGVSTQGPTGALDEPYQIDATRCISYWTIEQRGAEWPPEAEDLAREFGPWVFGCDICQDVCPWTKFARPTRDARFLARDEVAQPRLAEWAELDLEAFRERFRKSPIKRTKLEGLRRNVRNAQANASE